MMPNSAKKPRPGVTATAKALALLNRRWYGGDELAAKLTAAGYSGADAAAAVGECRRLGVLDDARLAEDYARSLAAQGRGLRRIRLDLRRHRLLGEAENVLNELAGDEDERAWTTLMGRAATLEREPDLRKRREKAFRFLAGRGFGAGAIMKALERW